MKKLNATVDQSGKDGVWIVTVINRDTNDEHVLTVEAETEKDAAFKAMEQINEQ